MTNPEVLDDAAYWFRSQKRRDAQAAASFVVPWEYDRVVEHDGRTFHIYRAKIAEGETAWALTGQLPNGEAMKPRADLGFWRSLHQLIQRHGLEGSVVDDESNEKRRRDACRA